LSVNPISACRGSLGRTGGRRSSGGRRTRVEGEAFVEERFLVFPKRFLPADGATNLAEMERQFDTNLALNFNAFY
jgi:hypothetical protein